MAGISIHIGLNHVDPDAYDGWDGELFGCLNDANDMCAIAEANGFMATSLQESEATSSAVIAEIGRCARELTCGDILLVSYSGHGGQVADVETDEEDGFDETWVLWDRQVVDDELGALWAQFAAGVRIVVFSDSCHSGTVLRALYTPPPPAAQARQGVARAAQSLSADALFESLKKEALAGARPGPQAPRVRMMPPSVSSADAHRRRALYDTVQWAAGQQRSLEIQASVLLISGCQDNQLSLDGNGNGLFTETLKGVWNDGAFCGSYRSFWQDILRQMPMKQSPNLDLVGTDWPAFVDQQPFCIGLPAGAIPGVAADEPLPVVRQTLRRGASGESVRELQERLALHGFDPEGTFGSATEAAVKQFQASRRLGADGVVGAKTWAALDAEPAPRSRTEQVRSIRGAAPTTRTAAPAPATTNATGAGTRTRGTAPGARAAQGGPSADRIRQVQRMLQEAGYRLEVSGTLDADTERHIRAFQADEGLVPTGEIDDRTYDRLTAHAGGGAEIEQPQPTTTRGRGTAPSH